VIFMFNFSDVVWKDSKNLKVHGAAITKGVCRSAEGKEFDFTDELMTKILSHFNDAVPIKIGHGNTPEVGRAYKMGFDNTNKNLPFEGHIYGDDKRKDIESHGKNKISPEIDFTFDAAGVPIDGVITALALVPIPAMEGTQVDCIPMTFSAPDESDHMKTEGIMVFYPKGTEVPPMAETAPVVETSPANFEAEISKYKEIAANFEAENVALKAEVTALKTAEPVVVAPVPDAESVALKAQIDEYKIQVANLTNENTGFIKEKTDVVIAELKTLGFKAPETIAADLPAKQRIELLKQMKSNFVTNAPAETPTTPVDAPKPKLTGKAAVLETIPEELRKYVKSGE